MKWNMRTKNLMYSHAENMAMKLRIMKNVAYILHYKYHIDMIDIHFWLKANVSLPNHFYVLPYFKSDVKKNVRWFLKHRHPVTMNRAEYNYIKELLTLPLSSSQIARGSGVKYPVISYLRNSKRQINKLSLATAIKLIQYYKSIKSWNSRTECLKSASKYFDIVIMSFITKADIKNRNDKTSKAIANTVPKKSWSDILKLKDNHFRVIILGNSNTKKKSYYVYSEKYSNDYLIINQNNIPKSVQNEFQKFLNVKPQNRTAVPSSYMSNDLLKKSDKIIRLHIKGLTNKQVAKKMNINHYLVDHVLAYLS